MKITMEVNVPFEQLSSIIKGLKKDPSSLRSFKKISANIAKKAFPSRIDSDVTVSLTDDKGPVHLISIKGFGIKRIHGGITFKDHISGKAVSCILLDQYGTMPMFKIEGDQAIWQGGLNSTEQERYLKTKLGHTFKYRYTIYKRLRMKDVAKLFDEEKDYEYVTPGA